MSEYFAKPYKRIKRNMDVEVDLSNYATKTDVKNATRSDISKLALKSNLASLKPEVDKIDVSKSKTVPADLSRLSNVLNNELLKRLCIKN